MLSINTQSPGLNRRTACPKWVVTIIALFATLLVGLGWPGLTDPAFAGPGGTRVEGSVTRFNVADTRSAGYWYLDNLEMEFNPESSAFPYYVQFYFPEFPDTQIGLSQSQPVGSSKATATIVVDDIFQAQASLEQKGVKIAPICTAGEGVGLAFFCDPDGNNLALRQNGFFAKLPPCGSPLCG